MKTPRLTNLEDRRVAIACDDGAVRIYTISDMDKLIYLKSFPRVSAEIPTPMDRGGGLPLPLLHLLSWMLKISLSESVVSIGGLGSGSELCIWSLLSLRYISDLLSQLNAHSVAICGERCGTVVSADSTGSVQFWNGDSGTTPTSNVTQSTEERTNMS
ncbi:hypothetical protein F3Y22_tig00015524pilonHSYRG00008 [Hibiscus syriacus]|uniref:Uncharacterized protein n=1 Tax=Hibiscus syriacus TaxID=106335 RepID=A0A6A3BY55_HIBSY|nr:hypothetical protein F3Y22_tig00015524pilonHSYRG00008 [Hibiscus syriacus]